jgi:hypothetical protein
VNVLSHRTLFSQRTDKGDVHCEHFWQEEAANKVFGEITLCDRKMSRERESLLQFPGKEFKKPSLGSSF